ncbi:MAG: hypothetical protein FWE05_13410 [Defluviitaleaceae bacterium]|nr:hypothetical protein [Defluviitaleaceae bacterium]
MLPMQPLPSNTFRLVSCETRKNKNGGDMTFLNLVNVETYGVMNTLLKLKEGQNRADIVAQQNYSVIVYYDGKYGSAELTPAKTNMKL